MNRNSLVTGPPGCGKSFIIKELCSKRDDIIPLAPSGIASKNINGKTIQSFFHISPDTYEINPKVKKYDLKTINRIRASNILLIDEISMLRCEIIDIADKITRYIRNNNLPFGGMKLLFFGDFYQMEPVVKDYDKINLEKLYPQADGNYYFFNAKAMIDNNFFGKTFDIFQIDEDYRHENDKIFYDILTGMRNGKTTKKMLNHINKLYKKTNFINEEYQYLTPTKAIAQKYNTKFIDKLPGTQYISEATILGNPLYTDIDFQFHKTLCFKENMKIMFVRNDNKKNGNRWVNGTIGKIIKIYFDELKNEVIKIVVLTEEGEEIEVEKEKISQRGNIYRCGEEDVEIASIEQFPIIPAYAITIDKSQGLTLDKIAIVMGKKIRDNLLYVALSRAKLLSDVIILERKIRLSDIHVSKKIEKFFNKYIERIVSIKNVE
jgi:hypothetical protein